MKIETIGDIIASRKLYLEDDSEVDVLIGKPQNFPSGTDYYCPFQILGLDNDKIYHAGGVDSIQALKLALDKIGIILHTSTKAQEGKKVEGRAAQGLER